MKLIVTGGRYYYDHARIGQVLAWFHPHMLVTGGCAGADRCATMWASANEVPWYEYQADWERFGNNAGPIRNRRMLDCHRDADLLVSFPGDKGTSDCTLAAIERGITVVIVGEGQVLRR